MRPAWVITAPAAPSSAPPGDFVTAPELGPLFASCVAEAVAPVLQQLGPEAEFVEIGGGSGAFAETVLKRLLALDAMPARYAILEPSADLRERQRERLGRGLIPPVFDRIEWLDAPPEEPWNGVLFANEVIDALPTPRFTLRDGEVFEENVALDGEGALRAQRPACRCACSRRRCAMSNVTWAHPFPTAIAPNCCRNCRTGCRR